jgi:AAA domain-containing protein
MGLFKPADNTMAYFKAGFMGEAGSGKTHTASLVTIGLVLHLRKLGVPGSEKPVFMLDTEQGSAWVKPMFEDAGIELMVAKTRTFKDLVPAIKEAEAHSSAMFIDSITHFWEELQSAYMAQRSQQLRKPYTRLEFQDWAILKSQWRQFSDVYVNSNLHCILCGRLGFEYDQSVDERGRKQIEKSGVKMRAEKDLGYEPNILVWMEREMDLAEKTVSRTAIVLKDRSQRLDGEQYPNPTFKTFLPHIDFLALGGKHEGVDTSRTSMDIIPDDDVPLSERRHIKREIVIEELDALLAQHGLGGTSNDAKTKRAELISKHFKCTSRTEIEKLMPLLDLQANFDALHRELTGKPSRYGIQDAAPAVDDEIPNFDEPGRGGYGAQKNNVDVVDAKPRVRVAAATAPLEAAE